MLIKPGNSHITGS